MAVSVLIVDDHAAFRAFARTLLTDEGFAVVGEAVDGATALEAARRLRPDVVLLDVQLPDTNGFVLAERFSEERDPPQVETARSLRGLAIVHRLRAHQRPHHSRDPRHHRARHARRARHAHSRLPIQPPTRKEVAV